MTPSGPGSGRERRRRAEDEVDSDERLDDVLLTTAQVSKLLQLNPRTVLDLVKAGLLPAHRVPGMSQFRFFRQKVLDAVAANPVVAGEAYDEDAEETGTVNAER